MAFCSSDLSPVIFKRVTAIEVIIGCAKAEIAGGVRCPAMRAARLKKGPGILRRARLQ
jgi:hypothetical protein